MSFTIQTNGGPSQPVWHDADDGTWTPRTLVYDDRDEAIAAARSMASYSASRGFSSGRVRVVERTETVVAVF